LKLKYIFPDFKLEDFPESNETFPLLPTNTAEDDMTALVAGLKLDPTRKCILLLESNVVPPITLTAPEKPFMLFPLSAIMFPL
jgi:hypothetical protein